MSIAKVAKAAGVSHTTVSNVINNRPNVSASTAAAVRQAMSDIDYTPRPVKSRPGRRPRSADGVFTGNVSLIWSRREGRDSPLALGLMQGISRELSERGLDLSLDFINPGDRDRIDQVIKRSDGLLVMGYIVDDILDRCRRCPLVWLGSHGPLDWGDRVRSDHVQITREAVSYLAGRGAKSLIYLNIDHPHPAFAHRKAAFIAEVERVGLKHRVIEPHDDVKGDYADRHNQRAATAAKTLSKLSLADAGLFAACDGDLAMVDRQSRLLGFDLMRELPLVSCNNDTAALAALVPPPATFDLQPERLGRLAAVRLAERMRGDGGPGQMTITLPGVLTDGMTGRPLTPAEATEDD